MQARNNGVRKFVQGVDVRWLSRDKSIAQMAAFLNLCAAAMILACGNGLTGIRVEMASHVLSGKGFFEDRRVRFSSKVERNIFCFTEPHFILDAWVTKLILKIAWVPIDDIVVCQHKVCQPEAQVLQGLIETGVSIHKPSQCSHSAFQPY